MKCPECKTDVSEDSHFCSKCGTPVKDMADLSISQTKTIQKPAISSKKSIAGKYRIIEEIGRGGMGIVYKAKDTRLDRTVALKFLSSELTQDDEAKQRFAQEAKAAAALNHPNISTIYEIDEHKSQTFISMEFIEGQTLKERLSSGQLAIDDAIDIATQVAQGLEKAHNKGIIHRDIKPANVMINEDGQAKITDFGLAKLSWGIDLTKTSTFMGTVAYMSPEQARGEKVDHRSDYWSLGAMLYEMLTGERPFTKDHEQALIFSILNDQPKPIVSLRSDVPSNIESAIYKALEKDPSKRNKSVQEFIDALKEKPQITTPLLEKSIAVLPFTNMSADPEQDYFCDGMTEEIINALTNITDLKVIARTSSFMFKGKHEDMREIGNRLDVAHLLEGSVRKAGNRLRITAQLIKVSDGSHLWSEKYDRNMEDVFDIQDEISLAIVESMKLKLLKKEKAAILKQPTEDKGAYSLYLKGRHFMSKLTDDGSNRAIELFEEAINRDVNFALAYAAMAESYVYLCWGWGICPPKDSMTKAKTAAEKAVDIDPDLAEAQNALAIVKGWYDWDRYVADQCFKRALKLNPNSSSIHMWYALHHTYFEHNIQEGIQELKRAQELDPLDLQIKLWLGFEYLWLQEYDKSQKEFQDVLDLDPHNAYEHHAISDVYQVQEEYEKAIEEMKEAIRLGGRALAHTAELANLYAFAGRKDKALEILRELEGRTKNTSSAFFFIGTIYFSLGDLDKTFECLEKALEERDLALLWGPLWFTKFGQFTVIGKDPRWSLILEKMGFAHLAPKETNVATKPSEIQSPPFEKSIVVLPFEDISPGKDNEYFSDGLTEEVISDLSKIQTVRVISRTSAMMLKGTHKSMKTIGRELNVQYVLEGSVRKAGNSLRITTQLIDATNDAHLWAEKYSGTLDDVFDIQEKVSRSIVNTLRLKLSSSENEQISEHPIENIQAYEYYLKARHEIMLFTEEGFERAIDHLNSGLEILGENALLFRGIGFARFQQLNIGVSSDRTLISEVEEYASRIHKWSPENPHGFFLYGCAAVLKGDFILAVKQWHRAYKIDPYDSDTLLLLGAHSLSTGQPEFSRKLFDRLVAIDPLVPINHMLISYSDFYRGKPGDNIESLRKAVKNGSDVAILMWGAVRIFAAAGEMDEAVSVAKQLNNEHPLTMFSQSANAFIFALQEQKEETLNQISSDVYDHALHDCEWATVLIESYAIVGETEKALELLEHSVNGGLINYPFLNEYDPFLENIRGEPRFKKLMERVKHEWENFEV